MYFTYSCRTSAWNKKFFFLYCCIETVFFTLCQSSYHPLLGLVVAWSKAQKRNSQYRSLRVLYHSLWWAAVQHWQLGRTPVFPWHSLARTYVGRWLRKKRQKTSRIVCAIRLYSQVLYVTRMSCPCSTVHWSLTGKKFLKEAVSHWLSVPVVLRGRNPIETGIS